MASAPIDVSILGCTGSIGRSALDVVRHYPGRFKVAGLATYGNVDLLADQIREFRPQHAVVVDEMAAARLKGMGLGVPVGAGPDALEELAAVEVDVLLSGIVGAAGLKPILRAIGAQRRIALANKEPLVMAGSLIMEEARAHGVEVLPVDSEHNAVFQCLHGHSSGDVRCVHLTASGGPFYGRSRESLHTVTAEEATRHPTWDMGAKISVDSATLMNKGFEVIEAMWLFDMPLDRVRVIIHPQSIVHSLVEFTDGNILAHLGVTDMRFPILMALTWPERMANPMARLDLTQLRELTFAAPRFEEFPCLAYALEAARTGGTAPAVLNAANEVAVEAFCAGRIGFLDIGDVVRNVLDNGRVHSQVDLETVLAADAEARREAAQVIERIGV